MRTKRREVRIQNPYDFYYKMEAEERYELLDAVLVQVQETSRGRGKRKKVSRRTQWYFPLDLTEYGELQNYCKAPGLLSWGDLRFELDPWPKNFKEEFEREPFFTVQAFSPDDLDVVLGFSGGSEELSAEIREHLMHDYPAPTTYRDYLEGIQMQFGGEWI